MRRHIMLGLLIMPLFLLDYSLHLSTESPECTIKIVYNNIQGDQDPNWGVAGGFSAWIECDNKAILFDAGGESSILVKNIRQLNLDIDKLEAICISHNHNDHVYGLPLLLAIAKFHPTVYVPRSAQKALSDQIPRAKIVPIDKPERIFPNVWSTGAIKTDYLTTSISEQALVIDKSEGIFMITGCAHPGIIRFVEEAKKIFPETSILLLAGGFHLRDHKEDEIQEISSKFKELGVKNIGPSHCTGSTAIEIFKNEWKDHFIRLFLGDEYQF